MNGILIVDKPHGWTSHDVVNFVRRRFNIAKVGHTGTLDPMATGVLVLLLGAYTKFSQEFISVDKDYVCILTLGAVTDTGDATGRIIKTQSVGSFTEDCIKKVLNKFTGETQQIPPMVSAIKIQGETLYKLARQGKQVVRQPRKIFISSLQLTAFNSPDISMSVTCSKGTYIRTLCEDIANALGSCGHMSGLRRTRAGNFSIKQAVDIECLKKITVEQLKDLIIKNHA